MGAIKDGLKIGAWVTDRIDQVSMWITKKVRINEVNSIDSCVDSGNDRGVNDRLQNIVKQSNDRQKANS